MTLPAPRERDVLRQCLDLLRLRGVTHWRVNTGAAVYGAGGRKRLVRFGTPGVSDVIGLLPQQGGRMFACEVKRPGKRPTLAQEAFLGAVRAAGGLAWIVSDVRELDRLLTEVMGVNS